MPLLVNLRIDTDRFQRRKCFLGTGRYPHQGVHRHTGDPATSQKATGKYEH
jgi:hypothetical protein